MKPLTVKVIEKKILSIKWDDDFESAAELKTLRRNCPCATCSSQRENQSESYIPLFYEDQIVPEDIYEVGNYAIGIKWRDGHNTGIYEFHLLRQIANISKLNEVL